MPARCCALDPSAPCPRRKQCSPERKELARGRGKRCFHPEARLPSGQGSVALGRGSRALDPRASCPRRKQCSPEWKQHVPWTRGARSRQTWKLPPAPHASEGGVYLRCSFWERQASPWTPTPLLACEEGPGEELGRHRPRLTISRPNGVLTRRTEGRRSAVPSAVLVRSDASSNRAWPCSCRSIR
jgi:hypothetical protein